MPLLKRLTRLWLLIVCLFVASLLVWQATRWVYSDALNKLITTSSARLTLYDGTLREALSRYAFLPYVLAQDIDVQQLLETKSGSDVVDRYLEKLNREAGSEAFFVMDSAGDTLSSSNWRDELTYVGQNYLFRPYFIDTQAGRTGRFFAIGATTGRPGYFFSHPVMTSGRNVGAAVVKVDLTPLQDDWHNGGETVLVSDSNGVVFLSSSADWNYRTLTPLSPEQLDRIRAGKQYGHQSLSQMPVTTLEVLTEDLHIIKLNKVRYLMLSRSLPGLDWNMHHLVSLVPVMKQARLVAVNGTILALLILALVLYGRERRLKEISRRRVREAEAFREMNIRLQEEIVEHNRTERVLRETQDELIQAGKLAALGHMAAGIVHELNQPIAAIKTYVASCRLLAERGHGEKLNEALGAIKGTTEHMASITAQLKSFAHKAPQSLEPIVVQESLKEVLTMTTALLRDDSVELTTEICHQPMVVSCHRGWIKQVLLNLIRNAVDAMHQSKQRQLKIKVVDKHSEVEITVADSGTGIAEHIAKELFTPFVTTKDVGDGLGLGLSICNRIIADLGGTIRAENRQLGGAQFVVCLPLADRSEEEHHG
jgi:two-component system, NtrC family, C4-dicarboxylate transport sensor histidine kinase DctB